MKNKAISICVSLFLFLFILTFSIGLPIYFRPFYYAHIDWYRLERTGFSKAEIKEAYNQVLDYLTLPGQQFGTGVMPYSESGASHFEDCKGLFTLNTSVLLISFAVLLIVFILKKRGTVGDLLLCNHSPTFWGGLAAILIPSLLGGVAVLDFDRAFILFHKIFFPGKYDWLFDPEYDPIILILPWEFFRNCAVLIGCSLIILCVCCFLYDKKHKRSERK